MTMAEDLERIEPKRPGQQCSFLAYFEEHPEDVTTTLDAMRNPKYSSLALADVFTRNGLRASDGSVRKHRANRCQGCMAKGYDYGLH